MDSLSSTTLSRYAVLCLVLLSCIFFTSTEGYDPLDPMGNITIRWDVMLWTPDGYVADVSMFNLQRYRQIQKPGWSLTWAWAKKEVIWSMIGAQTTEQGDCSKFKGNVPHCCRKTPTVVDLPPGTPYNQRIAHCCKGGVLSSWGQDPETAVSAFQVSVVQAGTNNKTVRLPRNFTLKPPGLGYTCGPARIVKRTKFLSSDKRRVTRALMTWNVTCAYSRFLAKNTSYEAKTNGADAPAALETKGLQHSAAFKCCVQWKALMMLLLCYVMLSIPSY